MKRNKVDIHSEEFKKFCWYNNRIEETFPMIGKQLKDMTRMITSLQKQIDELKGDNYGARQ